MISRLPADGQTQLEQLAARYQYARPPTQGHRATIWYRMRLLTLDWSEHWSRLAFFQKWRGAKGEKLDGTNNATEQITLALAVTQVPGLDNGLKNAIARCVDTNARNRF